MDRISLRTIAIRISSLWRSKVTNNIPWYACKEGNGARIMEVTRLWGSAASHCAFTDLLRHQNRWWCAFREGSTHMSLDGVIRIITSANGVMWETAALLESDGEDLRDPKFSVTPDGRFMLVGAGTTRQSPLHDDQECQSYVWFSDDGRSWGNALPVADFNYWLWRVSWHKDICYGIGYESGQAKDVRLYRSSDGVRFEALVKSLFQEGWPNEYGMIFLPDDTALCLLRRDPDSGLIGTAAPPYRDWLWKDTGKRIGGPQILQIPDGRIIAAVRLNDGRMRTSLCWVDSITGRLEECLALPSGGDNSYAGLVWHEGLLWVSYYSSHEGFTAIYLAKVTLDPM